MSEPITTSQIAVHGTLALFGAVVHALDAHRKGKSKTISDFLALTVMSSFTGAMFSILGFNFFPDQVYITSALAGMGGWLGVEGLAVIVDKLKDLISKK